VHAADSDFAAVLPKSSQRRHAAAYRSVANIIQQLTSFAVYANARILLHSTITTLYQIPICACLWHGAC